MLHCSINLFYPNQTTGGKKRATYILQYSKHDNDLNMQEGLIFHYFFILNAICFHTGRCSGDLVKGTKDTLIQYMTEKGIKR